MNSGDKVLPLVDAKVGVNVRQGKYRLRLPRAVVERDADRYISTGLDATQENLKRIQIVAWQIEEDLRTGSFDITLGRYKSAFKPKLAVIKPAQEPNLAELWVMYCEHRKNQVAATTFEKEYLTPALSLWQ